MKIQHKLIKEYYRAGNHLGFKTCLYKGTKTHSTYKFIIWDDKQNELLTADTKPSIINKLFDFLDGQYNNNITYRTLKKTKYETAEYLLQLNNLSLTRRQTNKNTVREYTIGEDAIYDFFINIQNITTPAEILNWLIKNRPEYLNMENLPSYNYDLEYPK